MTETEILDDYPELRSEDIQAALQFAYQLKDKVTKSSCFLTRIFRVELASIAIFKFGKSAKPVLRLCAL